MIGRWFASRRAIRDFALAIRPELIELPVPTADARLLERILASRAQGMRVILPRVDAARPRRTLLYGAALAAAGIVVAVFVRGFERNRDLVDASWSSTSWFAGGPVLAQTARPHDLAAPVELRPDRFRPLAVQYQITRRDTLGASAVSFELGITLAREAIGGVRAWRVTSSGRDLSAPGRITRDTAYLAADDLRMLASSAHQAPYGSFARIAVSQRFDDVRFRVQMIADRYEGRHAHRTADRKLSLADGPYVPEALAPLALLGVPLSTGWRGRFSVLGWAVRDDDVFRRIDLRVLGKERIRVPAGEFDCWRIGVESGGHRRTYWVRRADGLGIRSLDSTDVRGGGVRELALASEGTMAEPR